MSTNVNVYCFHRGVPSDHDGSYADILAAAPSAPPELADAVRDLHRRHSEIANDFPEALYLSMPLTAGGIDFTLVCRLSNETAAGRPSLRLLGAAARTDDLRRGGLCPMELCLATPWADWPKWKPETSVSVSTVDATADENGWAGELLAAKHFPIQPHDEVRDRDWLRVMSVAQRKLEADRYTRVTAVNVPKSLTLIPSPDFACVLPGKSARSGPASAGQSPLAAYIASKFEASKLHGIREDIAVMRLLEALEECSVAPYLRRRALLECLNDKVCSRLGVPGAEALSLACETYVQLARSSSKLFVIGLSLLCTALLLLVPAIPLMGGVNGIVISASIVLTANVLALFGQINLDRSGRIPNPLVSFCVPILFVVLPIATIIAYIVWFITRHSERSSSPTQIRHMVEFNFDVPRVNDLRARLNAAKPDDRTLVADFETVRLLETVQLCDTARRYFRDSRVQTARFRTYISRLADDADYACGARELIDSTGATELRAKCDEYIRTPRAEYAEWRHGRALSIGGRAVVIGAVLTLVYLAVAPLIKGMLHGGSPIASATNMQQRTVVQHPEPAVIATKDIPGGTVITSDMVRPMQVDPSKLVPNAVASTVDVVNRAALIPIKAGDQVKVEDIGPNNQQFNGMSSMFKAPYRAMTIALDSNSSVAGFLKPGDHVDVVGTFTVGLRTITRTVLQDVTLLATGAQVMQLTPDATADNNGGVLGGNNDQPQPQPQPAAPKEIPNATVEVTPIDAEKLILAANKGRLMLILRGNTDDTQAVVPMIDETAVTTIREQSQVAAAPPPPPIPQVQQLPPIRPAPIVLPPPPPPSITVIRGSTPSQVTVPEGNPMGA